MTQDDPSAERPAEVDPALAGLAERITRQIQAGDAVDIRQLTEQDPALAGPLLAILPTLEDLAALAELARRLPRSPRSRRDC